MIAASKAAEPVQSLSAVERAKDMPHPVLIAGAAERHPRRRDSFKTRSLKSAGRCTQGIWEMGRRAATRDGLLQVYDCFSYVVLLQLEAARMLQKQAMLRACQDERTPNSRGNFPLNTHGGLLSRSYVG